MNSSFHPGRVGLGVVTGLVLLTIGVPLLRGNGLERRAAVLHDELRWLAGEPPVPPPWQDRWEAALDGIGLYLEEAPERPAMAFDARDGPDHEPLLAWAHGLQAAVPALDALLGEIRRFAPRDVPHLARHTRLLGTREWQNTLLLDLMARAARGDGDAALRSLNDALYLARAADSGNAVGGMIRFALEGSALHVALGRIEREELDPVAVRSCLTPHLADWAAEEARIVSRLRREVSEWLGLLDQIEDGPERDEALATWVQYAEFIEEALSLAEGGAAVALAYERRTPPAEQNPWFRSLVRTVHERHARRNVTLTSLHLLEHHARHGSWPDALADVEGLSPELAQDPATGAELPWRVDAAQEPPRLHVGPSALGRELVWHLPDTP